MILAPTFEYSLAVTRLFSVGSTDLFSDIPQAIDFTSFAHSLKTYGVYPLCVPFWNQKSPGGPFDRPPH